MSAWSPNEKEWQELVTGFAKLHGWQVFHHLDSRGTEAGWPDLVLIRPPELLIVELKSERGKVTSAQEATLAALGACGVETALWRPERRGGSLRSSRTNGAGSSGNPGTGGSMRKPMFTTLEFVCANATVAVMVFLIARAT